MASFQDKNNTKWEVELTIAIARRVFDISKPDSLTAVLEDPYQRFDLLWLICEQQAAKLSIDQQTFDLLVSDEATYVAANEALLESLQAFFRRIGKESLALLMSKTREAALTLDKLATEKIAGMDQTLTQVITKAVGEVDKAIMKAGKSFLNSPESSELTPTP